MHFIPEATVIDLIRFNSIIRKSIVFFNGIIVNAYKRKPHS